MIEDTLLSTPQLANVEVEPSKENLPVQTPKDSWLSEIPLLPTIQRKQTSVEPSSCGNEPETLSTPSTEGKYEYEFSNNYNGAVSFIHLYDVSDISACERILHRPVDEKELTYSPASGNGFISDGEFKYTFTKQPFQRSVILPNIKAGVEYEKRTRRQSADDILSGL